jgi:DNA polymerase-3 subunit delta'
MWTRIIGQERVKRILKQALESGKLPNAYLFIGPEGTGKDAAAIEVAKTLNCLTPGHRNLEACDNCDNCRSIGNFTSPLVQFIFAKAKATASSNNDSDSDEKEFDVVDIAREELAIKSSDPYHNISIPKAISISLPQMREVIASLSRSISPDAKRVVIISEADTMIQQAQNAFLKTLEEPHQNTLIILTSSNPSRLYATILSRCQDLRFELLSPEELSGALIKNEGLEKEQALFLAKLSGGSYSAARSLISEDVAELRKQVVAFLRMGLSKSRQNALAEIDKVLPKRGGGSFLEKRQNVEQLLELLQLWLRDALAIAAGSEDKIFNADQLEDLKKFTARFGSPKALVEAIHSIEAAKRKVYLQLQLRPVMLELVVELERALVLT